MASDPPKSTPFWADARTIGLVGLAHGTSHFYHLLLPPLFPMLAFQYGYTYTELGFLVTAFFVVSGVGQAVSGFVVDRLGARRVLLVAMALFAAGAIVASVASHYAVFLLAAVLAGLGNAPMHPADFSVLNQRVQASRLGHAYAVHGISGNVGWALTPLVVGVSSGGGDSWRGAMWVCAAWAATVWLVLFWQREALSTESVVRVPGPAPASAAAETAKVSSFAFLRLPAVWWCFAFFFFSTCALAAVQSFMGPALEAQHEGEQRWWPLVLTAYMGLSAVGMAVGGFLAPRALQLERTITRSLGAAAALLVVAGTGVLGALGSAVLIALGGAAVGLAGPSRDLLIKRATPPGATGRVVGTVYSGLDVGFAVSAPIFGAVLDHGWHFAVFALAALALVAALNSAQAVGKLQRKGSNGHD